MEHIRREEWIQGEAGEGCFNSYYDNHKNAIESIPEYFNSEERGMYHYLTGAASWYMMTMITEVFGVRGDAGDLLIKPKLLKKQFNENKTAYIRLYFAGKEFEITFKNMHDLEVGEYEIDAADCDGRALEITEGKQLFKGLDKVTLRGKCKIICNLNQTVIRIF